MNYKDILLKLHLTPSFFEGHAETIHKKLFSAGEAIGEASADATSKQTKRKNGETKLFPYNTDFYGINQCIHLAITVQLLGSNSDDLKETLAQIQKTPPFLDKDPTMVVTSAVLYNLVTIAEKDVKIKAKDKNKIKQIHRRFDELNWMIGDKGAEALGIMPLEKLSK